ncbi:MAG: IS630 family transposase [Deltaproteobacteria bacterium]|nr:IS630 family transposase [Deltaproteobacteria bacterium]
MPALDNEYIARMEALLGLYEQPLDRHRPVVCLDERPVQLLQDSRPSKPLRPGRGVMKDYEYVRCGTANVFCAVEPKAGKHIIKATANRKAAAFAEMMRDVARKYPRARKIRLVLDNLSTHTAKSLVARFGERRGAALWRRFKIYYTPKHGSWLNQAEIEISLLSRQCLGRDRISSLDSLGRRCAAWQARANADQVRISWGFTRTKARKKFRYEFCPRVR